MSRTHRSLEFSTDQHKFDQYFHFVPLNYLQKVPVKPSFGKEIIPHESCQSISVSIGLRTETLSIKNIDYENCYIKVPMLFFVQVTIFTHCDLVHFTLDIVQ